jgi:hypothetical protein
MRAPHRLPVIVLVAALALVGTRFAAADAQTTSPATAPITATCGGPLTATAGQTATHSVSAVDPDGTIVSAGISAYVGNPAPGTITVTGVNPAIVTVDTLVPAGTYTVTVEFMNDDRPMPESGACDLVINVVTAPVTNQPITPACGGPLTVTAGQPATHTVSATDPDGTIVSAGISAHAGNPSPGTITVAGANPALVTVDALVPVGEYTVTIEFINSDVPTPQSAACDLVVDVVPATPTCTFERVVARVVGDQLTAEVQHVTVSAASSQQFLTSTVSMSSQSVGETMTETVTCT